MTLLRRAGAVAALALALAPAVRTAEGAVLEGRVIHPTRPEAAARIPVFLLGFTRDGKSFERSSTTDAEGRFSFEGLPADSACLLGATYDGIAFPGGSAIFEEGKPERQSQTFHIYDRTTELGAARVRSQRFTIEREAGVYRVIQTAVIHNPAPRVVVAEDGAPPLFRLAILRDHGEIEAPLGELLEGAKLVDGAVEVRGPLLPGDREVRIAYDVRSDGEALETELAFEEDTEEVVLLVRDFGVRVDGSSLHPSRPAREGDSIYLRYLGFDLRDGTRIPLRVEPLAPPPHAPGWARGLLAAGLAFGLGLLVLRPLERRAPSGAPEPGPEEPEHDSIAATLRDLEFDYETGKISAEDREHIREALRREAASTILRERRRADAAEPRSRGPCACGRMPQPGDRFCSACGARL